MNSNDYAQIANIKAYRATRDFYKMRAFESSDFLALLVAVGCNPKDKNHYKALWILELVAEERIALLFPYLDEFCHTLSQFTLDPAVRPASKICLFLVAKKGVPLHPSHEEKIIEGCLDFILREAKVATIAYALRALFRLGEKHPWVHDELRLLLSREWNNPSPGMRFVLKETLQRLAKK
ncbi:hypothetical protein [Flavobacterium sp.]|jgi:hypothetical protein|uniref:hypothetical protein n=1 Tax=Flavobacterium sp. TaxID=239 RepID=UPI0022BA9420|nr:hypothetical protein [Flavobacterium sp.]MCZ8144409.1 hypothetical protein [Flavobacterium sp.]MCZ8366592.1 hypothetical protein [Flavobacterium sp.]